MFLKRLTLENVRSIAELELDFDPIEEAPGNAPRKWTMLLGENGCGKSTVLRSIALALAGSDALSELLVDPSLWIRKGTTHARIAASVVTKEGETRQVELVLRQKDRLMDVFSRNKDALSKLDGALKHATRSYFLSGYGASRRLPRRNSEQFSGAELFHNVRAQCVATLFQGDAALRSLENWAVSLHYKRGSKGFKIIKDTFEDFLPEVKFRRIDRERGQLLFETPDGLLPLQQLSDGYQNIAAWCGDLLYRITETFQDYARPLETRGLLLIDEIDLHLHPLWQRQLVDFLNAKLPNFQIVATTHSPLTAQQTGAGELHMLQRSGKRGAARLSQYRSSPRRLRVDQLLVSPIFGLETAASKKVETMRGDYRDLKGKSRPTAAEKRRLADLQEKLSALPAARTASKTESQSLALLRKIQQTLDGKAAAALPADPLAIASDLKKL